MIPALRWLRFNAVGILGAGVQLAVLSLLVKIGVHYLWATALAVELAVLHNYAWHRRWTFVERGVERGAGRAAAGALWRFHLANGLVSIVSNLVLMRLFTGRFGWPPTPANLLAITLTSFANFVLSDRWVFPPHRRAPGRSVSDVRPSGC
ncbi:MAG TPA: GtrA family protein [Bryobacteraceae bacterium]|nr:GtrA family protein [Bryobacteraceae bacterium]